MKQWMNEQWILNYVNFRAYILLPFDWFKNNQLLSQLTHARYRDTVPLSRKIFFTHPSVSSITSRDFNLDFSFQPVHVSYIETLLGDIKCNKSCGPDNIMPKILLADNLKIISAILSSSPDKVT